MSKYVFSKRVDNTITSSIAFASGGALLGSFCGFVGQIVGVIFGIVLAFVQKGKVDE